MTTSPIGPPSPETMTALHALCELSEMVVNDWDDAAPRAGCAGLPGSGAVAGRGSPRRRAAMEAGPDVQPCADPGQPDNAEHHC
jgi:hypothetical protein